VPLRPVDIGLPLVPPSPHLVRRPDGDFLPSEIGGVGNRRSKNKLTGDISNDKGGKQQESPTDDIVTFDGEKIGDVHESTIFVEGMRKDIASYLVSSTSIRNTGLR
jgi:hypothetical protein